MTAIAMRKSVLDALTGRRRRALRWASARLELGEPAVYVAPPGPVQWYVWDDARVDAMDLATLGALAGRPADIPADYDPEGRTRDQVRDDIRGFVAARLVDPATLDLTGPNPWQAILDAQGAPPSIRAADSVPAGWAPLDSGGTP